MSKSEIRNPKSEMDLWRYELEAREAGRERIAGVDEAGRGPLAGPVVAAAVMLPPDFNTEGIRDSKSLTPSRRESAFPRIVREAVAVGLGIVGPERIDRINILQATYEAMRAALRDMGRSIVRASCTATLSHPELSHPGHPYLSHPGHPYLSHPGHPELVEGWRPRSGSSFDRLRMAGNGGHLRMAGNGGHLRMAVDAGERATNEDAGEVVAAFDFVLVDGRPIPDLDVPQLGIVEGDRKSVTIAAASIVAKVTRDRIMVELAERFPGYGFERHKGYGTEEHLRAIAERGVCSIHRRSFAPVARKVSEGCPQRDLF